MHVLQTVSAARRSINWTDNQSLERLSPLMKRSVRTDSRTNDVQWRSFVTVDFLHVADQRARVGVALAMTDSIIGGCLEPVNERFPAAAK